MSNTLTVIFVDFIMLHIYTSILSWSSQISSTNHRSPLAGCCIYAGLCRTVREECDTLLNKKSPHVFTLLLQCGIYLLWSNMIMKTSTSIQRWFYHQTAHLVQMFDDRKATNFMGQWFLANTLLFLESPSPLTTEAYWTNIRDHQKNIQTRTWKWCAPSCFVHDYKMCRKKMSKKTVFPCKVPLNARQRWSTLGRFLGWNMFWEMLLFWVPHGSTRFVDLYPPHHGQPTKNTLLRVIPTMANHDKDHRETSLK